jgi:hypothetical protein
MNEQNVTKEKAGRTGIWLSILALGSICGLIEVILGGILRKAGFSYSSGLLTGLGFAVIGFSIAVFKKPFLGIFIGIVAVLCKQLVVPILHVSVMCEMNSCLAVLLEYGAITGIAAVAINKLRSNTSIRILAGGTGALVGATAFYFVGMHVAPCNYLLSFNMPGGIYSFLFKESLSWIILSAVLFPIGWLAGEKLATRIFFIFDQRPQISYRGAALTTVLCWIICAVGISLGL